MSIKYNIEIQKIHQQLMISLRQALRNVTCSEGSLRSTSHFRETGNAVHSKVLDIHRQIFYGGQ